MSNDITADLSFDARKVRDGSALFNGKKRNPMTRVGEVDPQKGGENPTFGTSGVTASPGFGPSGPGSRSKRAGADRGAPPVWERQL